MTIKTKIFLPFRFLPWRDPDLIMSPLFCSLLFLLSSGCSSAEYLAFIPAPAFRFPLPFFKVPGTRGSSRLLFSFFPPSLPFRTYASGQSRKRLKKSRAPVPPPWLPSPPFPLANCSLPFATARPKSPLFFSLFSLPNLGLPVPPA